MEQIFLSGRLRRSLSCIPYACMIPQSYGVASDLLLTIITIMTNGNHTDIEMMLSELGVIRIVMCTPSGNITTLILRLAVVRDHGEKCHGSRGYKPPFRISKWYIIVIPLLALVMAPGLLLSALSWCHRCIQPLHQPRPWRTTQSQTFPATTSWRDLYFSTPICVTGVYPSYCHQWSVRDWGAATFCPRMPFVLRRQCDLVIITGLSNHVTEKYSQQRSQEPIQSLFPPSQYFPSNEGGDGHLLDLGSSAIYFNNCRRQHGLSKQFRSWPSVLALWALFKIWTLSRVLLILRVYVIALIF